MGLLPPAEPGSLLKKLTDVKAVDPPKKEFGTSKSKKSDSKNDPKDKADAEKPEDATD